MPNSSSFSFQTGPLSEANFDNVVRQAQRSGNWNHLRHRVCPIPGHVNGDNNPDKMMENKPQDLSIGGAMSSASSVSNMEAGGEEPVPSTSKRQVGSNDI
jgi:hypothetical protein